VQTVLPFTGLNGPEGVATDDSGSVYIVDELGGRLLKLSAGAATQTQTVLPYRGLRSFVAVDAARNVYVTDGGNNLVVKFAAGSNAETQLPFSMLNPAGVAVDSTGTVYVADAPHDRVLKLAAGAAKPSTLFLTGLNFPCGLAVDSGSNLYIADTRNNRVLKLARDAVAPTELLFTGLNTPYGVAVDSDGAVYVADTANNRVVTLPIGSTTQTVLPFTGLSQPRGWPSTAAETSTSATDPTTGWSNCRPDNGPAGIQVPRAFVEIAPTLVGQPRLATRQQREMSLPPSSPHQDLLGLVRQQLLRRPGGTAAPLTAAHHPSW
jgi:DNA-binding beta-propeller fold protein YncE